MRLLLVEDDDLIGSGLEISLSQAGYHVDWLRDGHAAAAALATTRFALVVLDLGLPGKSGTELLRTLRDAGDTVPVLVLTARGTVADRVRGLDDGADDYLAKPFELTEVLARCRALVRRSQGRAGDEIVWRDITIDLTAHTVTRDASRIALTSREWAILVQLVSHPGAPQSRARLEDTLYGWQEGIESNAIEVHVSNLRKKLGAELIRTVRGIGYVVDLA
ncbi:two-component regulatory system response regulator protein [Burkholderia lata]|uniref:Two-component regulatory system response regulator protein n=1 Tax=Burkholderia lata (strain ATCC 17760 / DSM 23089 / LMG 22485 / NCIMB 9086 / R18194 / 383) TaxID=482957 RepID=A0A6P2TKJ1_BURL3|nr:response regulator [Burkholderia lata]VWC64302.1 two-component regulatory system response regulator protein [Burkholderia lata]VWC66901.1 two-component regulatory system response regulator protein [Burkholderia lata]